MLAAIKAVYKFDQRVAIHEMPISNMHINGLSNTTENVVVKQFYLGVSHGWFASADGRYVGFGRASKSGWQWELADKKYSSKKVMDVIAMIENPGESNFTSIFISLNESKKNVNKF